MAFVGVLQKGKDDQEVAAACFAALRKLACNDKLCVEIGDAGVVPIALKVHSSLCSFPVRAAQAQKTSVLL